MYTYEKSRMLIHSEESIVSLEYRYQWILEEPVKTVGGRGGGTSNGFSKKYTNVVTAH